MFVYLKDTCLNENVFINTIIDNEYFHLQFNKETPFLETENVKLSNYILSTFPNLFDSNDVLPEFLHKKDEVKGDEVIPEPSPSDKIDEPAQESVVEEPKSEESVSEPVVEEKKEPEPAPRRRRGRPSNNNS